MGEFLINRQKQKKEFDFSVADFEAIRLRLRESTGINLSETKDSMVYSRLSRRIRSLGYSSFTEYLERLHDDVSENEYFINALTTNLTSFFREPHHFEILKDYVSKRPKPLVIWCAACSTGEEAYSIAMICAEARGSLSHNVRIYASDIDSNVMSIARQGVYTEKSVKNLNIEQKRRFFLKGKGSKAGSVKLVPAVQNTVRFFHQNLLDKDWDLDRKVDVIFCRNVMIYFDRSTQEQLVKRFTQIMTPDALYIAGHSENFSHLNQYITSIGKTVYCQTRSRSNG